MVTIEQESLNCKSKESGGLAFTSNDDFTSSTTELLVGERKFTLRALKMVGSTFLFIGNNHPECLDEIGVAMSVTGASKEVISTTVLGPHISTESQRLAEKLSKRYGRQFFVSLNAQLDRLGGPLLEKQLCEYIHSHENEFI